MQSFYSIGIDNNYLNNDGLRALIKINGISTNISFFESGGNFNIFYTENGEWYGGGDNSFYQQGPGDSFIHLYTKLQAFSGLQPKMISLGERISAYIGIDGSLFVTGSSYGFNYRIDELPPLSYISCGAEEILAIPENQKGIYVIYSPTYVKKFEENTRFIDCSAGSNIFLALDESGVAYSWGSNIANGFCGKSPSSPIQLKMIGVPIKRVYAKYSQSFLVGQNNAVFVAGDNSYSQLGLSTSKKVFTFKSCPINFTQCEIKQIAISEYVTFILDSSGTIYTSGYPEYVNMFDNFPSFMHSPNKVFQKVRMPENMPISFVAAGNHHVVFGVNFNPIRLNGESGLSKKLPHVPVIKEILCHGEVTPSQVDVSDAAFAFLGYEREHAVITGKAARTAQIIGICDMNIAVLHQLDTNRYIKLLFQHPSSIHKYFQITDINNKENNIISNPNNNKNFADQNNNNNNNNNFTDQNNNNNKNITDQNNNNNKNITDQNSNNNDDDNFVDQNSNSFNSNSISENVNSKNDDLNIASDVFHRNYAVLKTRSGLDLRFNTSDSACRVFGFLSGERVKHELIGEGVVVGVVGCNLWFAWDNDKKLATSARMNPVEMHSIVEIIKPKNRSIDSFFLAERGAVVTIETSPCGVLKRYGFEVNDVVSCGNGELAQVFGEFCYYAAIQYVQSGKYDVVLPNTLQLVRRDLLENSLFEGKTIVTKKSFNGKVVEVDVGFDEEKDRFIPLDRIMTSKGFATVVGKEIGESESNGFWIQTDDALALNFGVILMKDFKDVRILRRFSENEKIEKNLIVSVSLFDTSIPIYPGDVVKNNEKLFLVLGFNDQMDPVFISFDNDTLYEKDQISFVTNEENVVYRGGICSHFKFHDKNNIEVVVNTNVEHFQGVGFKPGDLISYPNGQAIVIGLVKNNIWIKNKQNKYPTAIAMKDAYKRDLFCVAKHFGFGVHVL